MQKNSNNNNQNVLAADGGAQLQRGPTLNPAANQNPQPSNQNAKLSKAKSGAGINSLFYPNKASQGGKSAYDDQDDNDMDNFSGNGRQGLTEMRAEQHKRMMNQWLQEDENEMLEMQDKISHQLTEKQKEDIQKMEKYFKFSRQAELISLSGLEKYAVTLFVQEGILTVLNQAKGNNNSTESVRLQVNLDQIVNVIWPTNLGPNEKKQYFTIEVDQGDAQTQNKNSPAKNNKKTPPQKVFYRFLMDAFMSERDNQDYIVNEQEHIDQQDKQKRNITDTDDRFGEINQKEQLEKIERMREMQKEQQRLEKEQKERADKENKDKEKKKIEDEQQKALTDKRRRKLQQAWEWRYNDIWESAVENFSDLENGIKAGVQLFMLLGSFRRETTDMAKKLIEDLCFPEQHRTVKELTPRDKQFRFKEAREMSYFIDGVIYRIAPVNTRNGDDEELYDDSTAKMLSHEFRSYEILADLLFQLRIKKQIKIRVPLTCIVDYLGFHVLCMADLPIEAKDSLLCGLTAQGNEYKAYAPLAKDLDSLSELLKLKPFAIELGGKRTEVQLSLFSEVHGAKADVWEDVTKILESEEVPEEFQEAANKQLARAKGNKRGKRATTEQKEPEFYYLLRPAHLFPMEIDITSKGRSPLFTRRLRPEYVQEIVGEPLSNGAFLVPGGEGNLQEGDAEGASHESLSKEAEEDDIRVAQAGQRLRRDQIKKLVYALDRLEILPIDSDTTQHAFHQFGINMRFLPLVAKRTELPHVRELCTVEIIARACKKIFRATLVEHVKTNFRNNNPAMYANFFSGGTAQQQQQQQPASAGQATQEGADNKKNSSTVSGQPGGTATQQQPSDKLIESGKSNTTTKEISNLSQKKDAILQKLTESVRDVTLSFYNMFFGCSEKTKSFWSQDLPAQVNRQFGQQAVLPKQFPPPLTPGALLHALNYHLRVVMNIPTLNFRFFNDDNNFTKEMIREIVPHSKPYQYRSIEIKQLGEQFREKKSQEKYSAAEKLVTIRLQIENYLQNRGMVPPGGNPEAELLSEAADIFFSLGKDMEAKGRARQALELIPPFHAESIRPLTLLIKLFSLGKKTHESLENYDIALKNIDFHWSQFHPLNAGLQSVMAKFHMEQKQLNEALKLFQTSLLCCTRILGVNHIQTADVYMDMAQVLYQLRRRNDSLQFHEKALAINISQRGPESIAVAKIYHKIALLNDRMGRKRESLDSLDRAIAIFRLKEFDNIDNLTSAVSMEVRVATELQFDGKVVELCDYLWRLGEKFQKSDNKNRQMQEIPIRETISCFFAALPVDRKNFLFKILLVFKEENDKKQAQEQENDSRNDIVYTQGRSGNSSLLSRTSSFSSAQSSPNRRSISSLTTKVTGGATSDDFSGNSETERTADTMPSLQLGGRGRSAQQQSQQQQQQMPQNVSGSSSPQRKSPVQRAQLDSADERSSRSPGGTKGKSILVKESRILKKKTPQMQQNSESESDSPERGRQQSTLASSTGTTSFQKKIRFQIEEKREGEAIVYTKGASEQEKADLLNEVVNVFRDLGSPTKAVKYILNTLLSRFEELNFQKRFFTKFRELVDRINDEQFVECLNHFTNLIKLFGEQFFVDVLRKRHSSLTNEQQLNLVQKFGQNVGSQQQP